MYSFWQFIFSLLTYYYSADVNIAKSEYFVLSFPQFSVTHNYDGFMLKLHVSTKTMKAVDFISMMIML